MAEKPSPLSSACPAKVFRKHYAKLLDAIQSPYQLAASLYAEDLIGRETKGRVTSSSGPLIEKSNILLDAVESTLLVSSEQKSTMLSLCSVLEESGEPALREIATDMRTCITG